MSAHDRRTREMIRELSILDIIRINERRDKIVPDTLKGYEDKFSMMFLSWLKIYMETDFHEYYLMSKSIQRYLELEFKKFCDTNGCTDRMSTGWELQNKMFEFMVNMLGYKIQ